MVVAAPACSRLCVTPHPCELLLELGHLYDVFSLVCYPAHALLCNNSCLRSCLAQEARSLLTLCVSDPSLSHPLTRCSHSAGSQWMLSLSSRRQTQAPAEVEPRVFYCCTLSTAATCKPGAGISAGLVVARGLSGAGKQHGSCHPPAGERGPGGPCHLQILGFFPGSGILLALRGPASPHPPSAA